MREAYTSPVVRFAARVQAPMLQLYGLYVLLHGHYGAGGGFQAGAALAGSFLIPRIVGDTEHGQRALGTRHATTIALAGVLLFFTAGIVGPVLADAPFLDYAGFGALPWPMPSGGALRAVGSLVIEIGVGLTVTGVMVILFDDLIAPAPPPRRP